MKLLAFPYLLTTKSLFVFEASFGLTSSNSVPNKVNSSGDSFGVLCSYCLPFPCTKSLSHNSGAGGGDSGQFLEEWHPCFMSRIASGLLSLPLSAWNLWPANKLGQGQSGHHCSQYATPNREHLLSYGNWVKEGSLQFLSCTCLEFSPCNTWLGRMRNGVLHLLGMYHSPYLGIGKNRSPVFVATPV